MKIASAGPAPRCSPITLGASLLAGEEGRPFLKAMIASPKDPAPRLIFADWLEERGRLEDAERIRAEVGGPRPAPIPPPGIADGTR